MDPFNMPGIDAPVNYGQNLGNTVSQVAPLASSYHGTQSDFQAQQIVNDPSAPKQSGIAQLFNKIGAIGSESAHIVEGAAKFVGTQAEDMVEAPFKFGHSFEKTLVDGYRASTNNMASDQLSKQLDTLNSDYKSGRISKSEYQSGLKDVTSGFDKLTQSQQQNLNDINAQGNKLLQTGIATAADIITIVSAGVGSGGAAALEGTAAKGTGAAASFLSSEAGGAALDGVAGKIGQAALSKEAFTGLPATVQNALKGSVTQILGQSADTLSAQQLSRAVAAKVLFTYPLTFNMLDSSGTQILTELQNKKYGAAVNTLAFNAALLLSGGPIGYALQKGGMVAKAARVAMFGDQGFAPLLAERTGVAVEDLTKLLNDNPQVKQNFTAMVATNLSAEGGNMGKAVDRFLGGLANAGWDIQNMTADQLINDPQNWADAARLQQTALAAKGLSPQEASRYTVGRWTSQDANKVAAQLTSSSNGAQDFMSIEPSTQDMLQRWDQMKAANPNAAWANSQSLDNQITAAVQKGGGASAVYERIRAIEAGAGTSLLDKADQRALAKLGFVEIQPVNIEAPFKEGAAGKADFYLNSTAPLPVLGSVGAFLTNIGLSPNMATNRVYELFNANLGENLSRANIPIGTLIPGADAKETSDYINKSLANYVHNLKPSLKSPPITDYRQLGTKDIMKALGVDQATANTVKGAIMDAMLQVPLSVRGIGDKLIDTAYKINPVQGVFSRYQGALRFAWNPFFQAKLSYKAEFLSQLEAGGKFPTIAGTNKILSVIMPEHYKQLDNVGKLLESKGVFGAGYAAEGADEASAGYSMLTHELLPSQRRSISGLVSVMSERVGMTPEQFVTAFPQETKDTVRMILQYDPRANFLNSPMARTLNLAFFPFRFNLKVTTIMARSLQRTSLATQMSVITGTMRAANWLQSPEGQAWYSKNADVIGLFKYFSPLETISTIAQTLSGLSREDYKNTVGGLGELGGLPFGFIPGLLASQGLIEQGVPYVNPTTGAIAKQYVPISARGRAKAAIEDFLGALYTYPGATIGLPSKTKVDVSIANALVPGGSLTKDFNVTTPTNLTPQQQQFQQVVQQLHGTTPMLASQASLQAGQQAYPTADPYNAPGIDVPVQHSPLTTPLVRSRAARSNGGKRKKADYTPYLLPGQTSLGQLP